MKKGFWGKRIAGFILIGIAAFALFTAIVMNLWNIILVPVLKIGAVGFWQAAGILVLSKILFGGFRGGRGWHRGGPWKHDMRERWANMSDDEKMRMKQEWKQRCNRWRSPGFERSANTQGSSEPQ